MTTNWARRLSVFLGASLLLPIISEFVASRIKHEAYDYSLALSLVAIVGPIALVLYYVKPVRMTARIIMSVGLMLSGLLVATLGYVLMTAPDRLNDDSSAPRIVGGCALGIGLLILSLGGLYFGRGRFDVPVELPAPTLPADPSQVKIERFAQFRSSTHGSLVAKIVNRLSIDDLHYVAYYVDGQPIVSLDLLDHPELDRYHEVVEPYQRREEYHRQGKALNALCRKLNAELSPLNTGDLVRLVFDVERGAIYYYVVTTDTNRFLIGVTLNQYKVYVADQKMAQLVDDIRVHLGQPRMTELEQAQP
jgi:hypothetical protein